MKKLLTLSLIGTSLIICSNRAKADWDYFAINNTVWNPTNSGRDFGTSDLGTFIYKVNSKNGEQELINRTCFLPQFDGAQNAWSCVDNPSNSYVNTNGELIISIGDGTYKKLDANLGTFNDANANWDDAYSRTYKRPLSRIDDAGNKILEVSGKKLLEEKTNGELHIGENSWITKEENGRQKVYAKDVNGTPIPIDYTNGTKLLINGRDVEQSINNVGALSAALTGLPTVPTDTTLACGFGTGTHGGDFAFSSGCASKVNEKLSINYAASMTVPGQDYAGDFEDQFSARAGFVWKLGKATKPNQISMNEKKVFETKIKTLEDKNNQLLARLEKLEKIALKDLNSKDLAVHKLK